MTSADEKWTHLPEPLQALLRELRAQSAASVRAALAEARWGWRLQGAELRRMLGGWTQYGLRS